MHVTLKLQENKGPINQSFPSRSPMSGSDFHNVASGPTRCLQFSMLAVILVNEEELDEAWVAIYLVQKFYARGY